MLFLDNFKTDCILQTSFYPRVMLLKVFDMPLRTCYCIIAMRSTCQMYRTGNLHSRLYTEGHKQRQ